MSQRSEYKRKKAAAALARRQASRQPKPEPIIPRVFGGLSGVVAILSAWTVFLVLMGPLPPGSIQSTKRIAGVVSKSRYEHQPYLPRRAGVNEFRLRLEGVDKRIKLTGLPPSELETLPIRLPPGSAVELQVTSNFFGDYWLWQIHHDGSVLVRFADTAESALGRAQFGARAFLLLLVSASVYWKFRPQSPIPRYRRPTRACS